MKSCLYLAKEPDAGVRNDLSHLSHMDVTIVDCLGAYGDYYRKIGYNVISKSKYYELTMKFDVIIGNPPYQGKDTEDKAYDSLWPKFWKRGLELLKPGGKIALITPLTWCAPTSEFSKKDAIDGETRLWEVFNKYTSVADVTNIKKHFPGTGSTFSLVTVDTSGSEGLSFTDGFDSSLGFYPLSGQEEVMNQLSTDNNIASRYEISSKFHSGHRVSLFKTRKITPENVEVCDSMQKPTTNGPDSLYAHIYTDTKEEADIVRERVLECSDVLYKHCRYHGFIDLKILGMIKL